MDLVDALARNSEPMNLKRLATQTGLHTSSAHRILAMMVAYRIVDRGEPGMYRLGIRWLELGNVVKSRINLRAEAMTVMQRLHLELRETINLCLRQGDEVVYVERAMSDRLTMRVAHLIGSRAPLHATATGKIFLLEDGAQKRAEYATRTGLRALTKNTIREIVALDKEMENVEKLGVAYDHEEAEVGVSCIGAGVRDDEGKLVAGLSISAPSARLDQSWGAKLLEAANQISRALGFQKPAN